MGGAPKWLDSHLGGGPTIKYSKLQGYWGKGVGLCQPLCPTPTGGLIFERLVSHATPILNYIISIIHLTPFTQYN